MNNSVKPFFKNKAQEKAWRKSFTAENRAAAKKLMRDLNELGPEGVARRDKAEHLAREAKEDAYAAAQAREQFKQAVELKHTLYDPNSRVYEARFQAFYWRKRITAKVSAAFIALRCWAFGHVFLDKFLKRGSIEKCKRRGCPATKYW